MPQAEPETRKNRSVGLDVTRIYAFLSVVAVHSFLNTEFYSSTVIGKKMYVMVIFRTAFMVCVPLFLLLTGYLVSAKNTELNSSCILKYYKKLLPLTLKYIICMLIIYALSMSFGAKCSIGDQMHPLGEMNMATYNLIGKAYSLIEQKEPWLNDAVNIADIAVLSAEAVTGSRDLGEKSDVGANRMLLETHRLYNFVDAKADLSSYKMLILPDVGDLPDDIIEKIKAFAANGGKIIASGRSLIKDGKFYLDIGAEYKGENEFYPTYFVPCFDTVDGTTQYVMKSKSYLFDAKDCNIVGCGQNPYFNRTLEHFCSHQHAPNNPDKQFPAVAVKGNIAYIGWDIFNAYANEGHLIFKEIFAYLAERLLGDEASVKVSLPDRGIVTLTRQSGENRIILHLLFAHTTVRGRNTEVIEDTVPLYDIKCSVKAEKAPSAVTLEPQGESLPFVFENGNVSFTVPKVDIHQMVCIKE